MNNNKTEEKVVTVKLKDAIEIALDRSTKRWKIYKVKGGRVRTPINRVSINKTCIYFPRGVLNHPSIKGAKYVVLLIGSNNEIGIRPLSEEECNPLPLYSYKLNVVNKSYGAHIYCKSLINKLTDKITLGYHKFKWEDGVLVISYNLKTGVVPAIEKQEP